MNPYIYTYIHNCVIINSNNFRFIINSHSSVTDIIKWKLIINISQLSPVKMFKHVTKCKYDLNFFVRRRYNWKKWYYSCYLSTLKNILQEKPTRLGYIYHISFGRLYPWFYVHENWNIIFRSGFYFFIFFFILYLFDVYDLIYLKRRLV